jgi:hypothetical protein
MTVSSKEATKWGQNVITSLKNNIPKPGHPETYLCNADQVYNVSKSCYESLIIFSVYTTCFNKS